MLSSTVSWTLVIIGVVLVLSGYGALSNANAIPIFGPTLQGFGKEQLVAGILFLAVGAYNLKFF